MCGLLGRKLWWTWHLITTAQLNMQLISKLIKTKTQQIDPHNNKSEHNTQVNKKDSVMEEMETRNNMWVPVATSRARRRRIQVHWCQAMEGVAMEIEHEDVQQEECWGAERWLDHRSKSEFQTSHNRWKRQGTLAPRMPKEALAMTGNGMPNLVPAWALNTMGMSTITLASSTVRIPCHHAIPISTKLPAK